MEFITHAFNHRIARYLFSGGTATAINLGLTYILTDIIGLHYLISGTLAFSCGVVASFIMQKRWTFQDYSTGETHRKFGVYVVIAIVNLAINASLLYLFTHLYNFHYMVSQFLASAIIAFLSYFIYKKMVFCVDPREQ